MRGRTQPDPKVGSELAGYRVERLLGRGGMSVVYLAEQVRLKRPAALKLLAPELADDERFRERFLRESELAASLDHPSVIPIYDAGEVDGQLYIAMRYVEGSDLRALLLGEGRLEPERALRVLRPVADALDYAHAHGLVHRDVKPGNILLAADGPVYLSDFGLTRRVDEGASLTEAGELVGSIDYAAPEQIDGRAVDGRADVYSLACVTYECLTGSVPFPRDSPMAKLWAHLRDSPLPAAAINPDLPSELDPVLQRGLAKNPDDRYPTASELTDGVQTAVALPAPPSTAQRSRRTLIAGTLAALAAIAALTVALVLTLGGENTRPDPILPLAGDSVVGIDSASGEVTAAVAVQEPGPIAAGLGFVWIIDQSELIQIDPETARRRVVRLDEPFPEGTWPPSIAAGEGSIWLAFAGTNGGASGRWLWRVNAATGEIVKLDRAIDAGAVVVGSGAVWVNVFTIDSDGLLKILPRAVEVAHSIDGPEERFLTKMAIGATGLWVLLASSIEVTLDEERALADRPGLGGDARTARPFFRTRRFRRRCNLAVGREPVRG